MQEVWPVPLNDIIFYVCHLYKKGCSFSTVNCYLSGISFVSKLNNFEDNTQRFIVRKLVEGVKRSGSNLDTRLPITRDILDKIVGVLPSVCSSVFECRLFTSAFILAFHGMFRVGELTVDSKGNALHTVEIEDICVMNQVLKINIRSSKTDQMGKGTVLEISRVVPDRGCPVANLQEYLKVRPSIKGPLFCHFNGKALTRYQFSAILKKSLAVLGFIGANFKSHSFRIGRATMCAIEGIPDHEIKVLGRWKSDSYLKYIRIPN